LLHWLKHDRVAVLSAYAAPVAALCFLVVYSGKGVG